MVLTAAIMARFTHMCKLHKAKHTHAHMKMSKYGEAVFPFAVKPKHL